MKPFRTITAALIVGLLSASCLAAPVSQSGAVSSGHAVRWITNGVVGDAGTAGTPLINTFGVTATGTPFCINDINPPSPYHQLCLGADSPGVGVLTYNAYGGATEQDFQLILNGTSYSLPFVLPGTGVIGPVSSTIGNLPSWANTQGTLLNDSGVAISNVPLLSGNNTWTGTNSFNGTAFTISRAAAPALTYIVSGVGSDLKRWDAIAASGVYQMQATNDANNAATTFYIVTRGTTYNIAQQDWYVSTVAGTPLLGMTLSPTVFNVRISGTIGLALNATSLGVSTSGGAQFQVLDSASAVNYATATGSATGVFVKFGAAGSDTNIGTDLSSKGSSDVHITTGGAGSIGLYTAGGTLQAQVTHTASADRYLKFTGGVSGSSSHATISVNSGSVSIGSPLLLTQTTLLSTSVSLTNGAAAQTGTMTNGPCAGNPTKWVPFVDNGTTRYLPAWSC